jgi:hypothetical protein
MSRAPQSTRQRAVAIAKTAVVGAISFVAVAAMGTTTEGMSAAQELSSPPAGQARLDKLIARHDCSPTGFGPGVIPGSALVERRDKIRHVSFDHGWAVFNAEKPGTLLAVCRVSI